VPCAASEDLRVHIPHAIMCVHVPAMIISSILLAATVGHGPAELCAIAVGSKHIPTTPASTTLDKTSAPTPLPGALPR
jgi:hypothetical protein